ncbi:hypothetical protein EHO59_08525 [Leptospira semungkisensis]|uniref:Lipoprotein n=1 Tax=Leptospira semungkisensis TaxID=2484985 RepID=A0A4R9G251_9LEPT|nr:LIC12048 family lipoprotein [Leptospira semungkisensis]TGK04890.1 hypothetical protein EHO59_08525 [Leptospira semungkisensis]
MKKKLVLLKTILVVLLSLISLSCFGDWGWGKKGDVDLSKATRLTAEMVPLLIDKSGIPKQNGGQITPVNGLFNLPPGTSVPVAALGGAIDPTGTTIVNDFDGDGILNVSETTTNVWVADYPQITAKIAPPVTMKIQILNTSSNTSDEIVSEIHADDLEDTKNQGTEKIHQNEINLKTVQFQDTYASSLSLNSAGSSSMSAGITGPSPAGAIPGSGPGINYGQSNSNSWGVTASTSKTVTKWADRPFKNNLDRDAVSLKSDSTGKNSRNYRAEKTQKTSSSTTIKSDAGYVRAALYITNESVNMPVKLTNILCSLMFENAAGDLIPVQSFRLRNDDYSLFEISVYGGSEFGPYVVELAGLNKVEVEQAITSGYNPKIFIVDYEMSHVPNSNYASTLLNFSGDNLKVIEENAKGRTAMVKIIGPDIRESYRVAAFDVTAGGSGDPCTTTNATQLAPGISFEKALNRISCSGMEIIFSEYVLDLSEIAPTLGASRIYTRAIKSIAGKETNFPCDLKTFTGSDGTSRTACVQKPINQWTDAEKSTAGIWIVFSKGKYYDSTTYLKSGNNKVVFDPINSNGAFVLQGASSTIWAGDYYDIVYYSIADYLAELEAFGKNPLENGQEFSVNSKWDNAELGDNPYDPDKNSIYLGEAGFGEKIELTISLLNTNYLNPSFGTAQLSGNYQYFTNFRYTPAFTTKRFAMEEVTDFELSLGFSGYRTDWLHIVKDLTPGSTDKIQDCGSYPDYQNQVFVRCIQLPSTHPIYDITKTPIKLYLRPAFNSAYRNTAWPLNYQNVRKVRGELGVPIKAGDLSLKLLNVYGNLQTGDTLYIEGDNTNYLVSGVTGPDTDGYLVVTITNPILKAAIKTTAVYIPGTLTDPEIRLAIDNNFVSDWNGQYATTPTSYTTDQYVPLSNGIAIPCSSNLFNPFGCLGLSPDYNALNWMGSYNKGVTRWNSWSDGGGFAGFLAKGLPSLKTSTSRFFRFEATANDYIFSDPGVVATLSNPVTLVEGDNGFVIWKQGTSLKGKFFQVSTGLTTSSELTLNTQPIGEDFVAKVQNGKAVISWENVDKIYLRVWDMNTKAAVGAENLVVTRPYASAVYPDFLSVDLALSDTRALVVWNSVTGCASVCNYHHNVNGRVYQTSDGTSVNAAAILYAFDITGSVGRMVVVADANGDKAVVASLARGNNEKIKVHAIPYTLSTATPGTSILVDSYATFGNMNIAVKASNGIGLIVYDFLDTELYSRSLNLSTSALIGSRVTLSTGTTIANFKLGVSGDTGLIAYSVGNRINLKALSISGSSLVFPSALIMDSSTTASSKSIGSVVLSGNNIITLWEHQEDAIKTIRGRLGTLSPFQVNGSGEFFLSTTNQGDQTGPTFQNIGSTGLAIWLSQDSDRQKFRGFSFDLMSPGTIQYGLNNFFVAPLIERNYLLKGRIIF